MNKKRSQVAHYVKCELLVARRPLTIFFLPSHICPILAHPIRCDVCAFVVALVYFICFTLYDVAGLEICVLCAVIVYMKEEKKNRIRTKRYPHQIESRVLFVLFGFSFNCFVCVVCVLFHLSSLLFVVSLFSVCFVGWNLIFSLIVSFVVCSCCYLQCEKENLCGQNKFT